LRPNFGFGWFCTERGRTSGKLVFLLFLDKDSFVSKGKNVSKWAKFFPQRPNFSAKLAGKVCQELATLVVH
jgi:hypothetical protein